MDATIALIRFALKVISLARIGLTKIALTRIGPDEDHHE
jgi:hypothetical protein